MKPARRLLERFEGLAETLEAAGRLEDAIQTVELGATFAAACHPGLYTSLRMERLLARAGATLRPLPPRPDAATGRVLHVATETYAVGGHSRMIWRWVDRDPGNVHVLVSTTAGAATPPGITAAIEASGGAVHTLAPGSSNLERAQALRDLAAGVDLVVVHAHAMDPVPTVAFAEAEHRPPVVVFNHADHHFWLGAAIADVLHCIRPVSLDIAATRGIAAERCVLTTAPVSGSDGNGVAAEDRAARRADLLEHVGWPADSVLLFSAGSGWKYRGPADASLLGLVEPVLHDHPDARLIVAGSDTNETWDAAAARTGGRVAAVGAVPALAPLFAAADIYLESRPFSGTGASSEAAAHGLPVLTHAASDVEASLLCTDARYGTTAAIGPSAYRRELARLIAEPGLRADWGERAREAIQTADAAWGEGVARVTRRAAELAPVTLAELRPVENARGPRDVLVDVVLRLMHGVDADGLARWADRVELLVRSPGLRAAYGDIAALMAGPTRPYRAAVALAPGDPRLLPAVVAEFRQLQALGAAERFAIGLLPDQAEAAIPVLEAELDDDSITVEVFVDEAREKLVGDRCLEVVAPGATGTGLAPIHQVSASRADRRAAGRRADRR